MVENERVGESVRLIIDKPDKDLERILTYPRKE
jgi:hypothetical protein